MKNITIERLRYPKEPDALIELKIGNKKIRIYKMNNRIAAMYIITGDYKLTQCVYDFEGGLLAAQAWAIEKLGSEAEE